jgi:hypothetical protein
MQDSCECTLGSTLLRLTEFPVDCRTDCSFDADICFRSCQKNQKGTKNIVVTECGEQIGYKLEYYLSSGEVLNIDNKQCTKEGNILTCYKNIAIDEQNAKILITNRPENIEQYFWVRIKEQYVEQYTKDINIMPKLIASFAHDELILEGNPLGTNPANICFVDNVRVGMEWFPTSYCSVYPHGIDDTYEGTIQRFRWCNEMIGPMLEYYISDYDGTNKEILNVDNEQCIKEGDMLTCYGGVIIDERNAKILIDEQSLSKTCVVTAELKDGHPHPVKPLEIYSNY